MNHWELLDVAELMNRRNEATTSGNVGAYPVPLGQRPMRSAFPSGSPLVDPKSLEDGSGGGSGGYMDLSEYWAAKGGQR